METKVTDDMNTCLTQEFTKDEIEAALKQMAPLKSPSPNGFGACFFQSHWHIVEDYVQTCAQDFEWRGFEF